MEHLPVNREIPFIIELGLLMKPLQPFHMIKEFFLSDQNRAKMVKYSKIILLPAFFSRLSLQIVGYLSLIFLPNPQYPTFVGNDWFFSPVRILDIWARWDTGWYHLIASNGYSQNFNVLTTKSDIAFFPLYPLFIRVFSFFLIDFSNHKTLFLVFALLVSNISFLIALFVIYKLAKRIGLSDAVSESTILLIIFYPYSFFFSAAYSESLFLLFFVLCLFFCATSKWTMAAISGGFLALTRPLGIVIVLPILVRYLIENKFKIQIKQVAPFALIPLGFVLFLYHGYTLTGDFLAPMNNQLAWGKVFQMPWTTIVSPNYWRPVINEFDLIFTVIAIILLIVYIVKRIPYFEWALYSLILVVSPLFYGVLQSNARYSIVAVPLYFSLGLIVGKREKLQLYTLLLFVMIQAVLFAGWVRGYFIV